MNPDTAGASIGTRAGAGNTELASFLSELRPRVEPCAPLTPLPESDATVRQVSPDENLIERFAQAAASAGMHVHRTSDADWIASIGDVLQDCDAKTSFVAPQPDSALPLVRADELTAALAGLGIDVRPTPDDETLFNVDTAVTGVSAAIAETGTIVCPSGPELARGASLIPPLHIAVVAERQLVPDLCDFFARLDSGTLPANVNLITGPSKTADIEGILVTGVHGPGQVHIVLITNPHPKHH